MTEHPPPADPAAAFDEPRLISRDEAAHHVWGDAEGGLVTDRVIASTDQLHVLEFELAPGGRFRHTAENPTLFAADVAYLCLAGTLVLADPTPASAVARPAGRVLRPRHVAPRVRLGAETTRVLEFMSPPPSPAPPRPTAAQPLLGRALRRHPLGGTWPDARPNGSRPPAGPLLDADALLSFRGDSRPPGADPARHRVPHRARGLVQPGTVDAFAPAAEETVVRVLAGELWVDVRGAAPGSPRTSCRACTPATLLRPPGHELRLLVRADRPATYLQGSGRVPPAGTVTLAHRGDRRRRDQAGRRPAGRHRRATVRRPTPGPRGPRPGVGAVRALAASSPPGPAPGRRGGRRVLRVRGGGRLTSPEVIAWDEQPADWLPELSGGPRAGGVRRALRAARRAPARRPGVAGRPLRLLGDRAVQRAAGRRTVWAGAGAGPSRWGSCPRRRGPGAPGGVRLRGRLARRYEAESGPPCGPGGAGTAADPVAARMVATAGAALAEALAEVVQLVDPEVVILGGGLGRASGPPRTRLRHRWAQLGDPASGSRRGGCRRAAARAALAAGWRP